MGPCNSSSTLLRETYGERFLEDQKNAFLRENFISKKRDQRPSRTQTIFRPAMMRSYIFRFQSCLHQQKFNSRMARRKIASLAMTNDSMRESSCKNFADNYNRTPSLRVMIAERELKEKLSVSRVVWLVTSSHNFLRMARNLSGEFGFRRAHFGWIEAALGNLRRSP